MTGRTAIINQLRGLLRERGLVIPDGRARFERCGATIRMRARIARKLAVILHAMWKTNAPFRWSHIAA